MANNYFQFKQFTVLQHQSSMKVSTDSVLLGAWVNTGNASAILDIGTGTGLLALMMAQKSDAKITAVEIDTLAAEEAAENFKSSKWSSRLKIHNCAIQDFNEKENFYDLIVCNPPYFIDSLTPSDNRRLQARHSGSLPLHDLLRNVIRLGSIGFRFNAIFPAENASVFFPVLHQYGLYCIRRTTVYSKPATNPLRVLVECSAENCITRLSDIIIHNTDGTYTEEYKRLTQDFYLNF